MQPNKDGLNYYLRTAAEARRVYDIPNITSEEVEIYIRRQLANYQLPSNRDHRSLQSLIRSVGPHLDWAIVMCNFLKVDPFLRERLGFDPKPVQAPGTLERHPWEIISRCCQSLDAVYFGILDYYGDLFKLANRESDLQDLLRIIAHLLSFKASETQHPSFESMILEEEEEDDDIYDAVTGDPKIRYMHPFWKSYHWLLL